ncbi:hypothetical protein RHSIM_Rhsim04G0119700 [Rhododendron simsii]|uniref:Uncharacterized protein n=1 Tax=Rhododendron simsii TaxID=118357 RepID=A0A834LSN4_RHOSS|nr:hypothetical protein RHSIM_Rhsim04G0119700 [Rhododendron simsii]
MYRIHPDSDHQNRCVGFSKGFENVVLNSSTSSSPSNECVLLTVWKRSSMTFQGTDGFTVIDSSGRLAFRVDNYTRKECWGGGGGVVLMDGHGKPLLTLKPQMLSMQYQWNAYRGDQGYRTSPKSREFIMRRSRSMIHSNRREYEAEVFMGSSSGGGASKYKYPTPDFKVEGSFSRRNCKITSGSGTLVAKITRKRVNNTTMLLNDDVFCLVVQPGFDPDLIMAFVIVLDRISPKPFAPILCFKSNT